MDLVTWEQQAKNRITATRKAVEEFAEKLEASLQSEIKNYPLALFVYGGYSLGYDATKNCFVYQQLVNMVPHATEIWKAEILQKNGVTNGYSADELENAVSLMAANLHGTLSNVHVVEKDMQVYRGQIEGKITVEFNV